MLSRIVRLNRTILREDVSYALGEPIGGQIPGERAGGYGAA